MNIKKISAAVMAAAVLAVSAPVTGLAEPLVVVAGAAETEGDFEYSVNDDGNTVTITKYVGTDTEVVIPSTLGGKTVTIIGSDAFCGRTSLISVIFPDSITYIGAQAFDYCSSLTNVTIPDSVTSIGVRAFGSCTSLEKITVGENNASYSSIDGVLFNKEETVLICYPAGKKDSMYTIPNGVTEIYGDAFENCTFLTNVTIPNSVTRILWDAFAYCSSLTKVIIPDSVTEIGNGAFQRCKSFTSVEIPDSVKKIGSNAFLYCTSLSSVKISNSVTEIGDTPFQHCTSLKEIIVDENNANYLTADGILFNKDKTRLVCFPAGKEETSYIIPDSVTKIDDVAFGDCTSLISITIPNSVTEIGRYAFDSCTALTSMEIPNSVTTISYSAFSRCKSLSSVTIPKNVTVIDEWAFGDQYFDGCTSLKTVNYDGTKSDWEAIEIGDYNECLKNAEIICTDGIINEREPVGEDAHTLEKHEAVSATCLTEGNDVYWECSGCGKIFSDENGTAELDDIPTIAKTAHTWNDGVVTTQPTISTEGVKTYTCTVCSITKTEAIPLFDKDSETTTEVEMPPEAADIPDGDKITSITFNKAFNMSNKNGDNVELDLKKLTVKAAAIYDEAGLKRASEALGTTISGNTHYNLLDLTLLYDGKDFSNGYNGLVQVTIPIPEGHRDKFFSCYRIVEKNGKKTKELIPGEQTKDSYIIYLEHFSEYALVASDTKQEHVHTWDNGTVTKQPTTTSEGIKTYTCMVCSETRTEAIAKLSPSGSGGSGSKPSGGSSRPSGGGRPSVGSSSSIPSGMTNEETAAVIKSTKSGGTAKIDGNIFIYSEVINEAVKKNIDLEVKVDYNFTWNIDTNKLGDVNTALRLSVTKENADTNKISMIEKSYGSINNSDMSFSTYAKNLGMGATLTVRTSVRSTTSSKQFANLYKTIANGNLEFVSAALIDENGYTTLPIFEAATYTLIMSTETKKPGDINNDCKVDLTDITAMLKKYVNSYNLSRSTDFKMDYDNDGQCGLTDVTQLLKDYVNNNV